MRYIRRRASALTCSVIALFLPALSAKSASLLLEPGHPVASVSASRFELGNEAIEATWSAAVSRVGALNVTDKLTRRTITEASPFAILMKDGAIFDASDIVITGPLHREELQAVPDASGLAERSSGVAIELPWKTADGSLTGTWRVVLRDGSNYVRQILTITAGAQDAPISRVELIDLPLKDASVVGSVEGSPIIAGDFFLGFEHPMSKSKVTSGNATAWMERELPLQASHTITYSSVIGVARSGQMRRDFLAYVERERAHPYRTFLHYNSWYDLGYFTPYDEKGALDRVNTFGRELSEKRGVKLDSYLFDDGWDDHRSLWKFNTGFPQGFANVRSAAEKYGADPGVWMSPWGGYSKPKQERIEFGKAAGYEIVSNGYALSGPKYYDAFRDVCLEMISKYGVNQFKFDGTGNADSVFKGSRFDSDFDAAIHLISEIRAVKPDIFINLTTGTWPSPFWLMRADSIWRGGWDDNFAGVGTCRERWITYRDADTYQRIVQGGPLYPLNSLMLHGMIYAQHRKHLDDDPGGDFRNEIHSYFGTGTQLQEMYITPSLLTQQNWDDLAEAAKWSRSNAETLKDTHWVGGDPAWLQVYGWASWSPKKGILTLRNPSDKPQSLQLVLSSTFELPSGAPQVYLLKSPWKADGTTASIRLRAAETHTFALQPFEVLNLEAIPVGK
ncbi:hypothetical protein SAMN05421819_0986 [Bryocella elongata]|uniref:Enterotoxin n=1 Tax=Bryocella elongata TaxID=863522 RepID=A0A1H5UE68_9BACT|nr:enterotoxin [Bryocella elongata]SEF73334.1 hypothetical protein SAMN05421819_0986 [Bryocella elongata]